MSRFNWIAVSALSAAVLLVALAALVAGERTLDAFETALAALRASPSRLAVAAGMAAALAGLVLLLEARAARRGMFQARLEGVAVEYAAEVVARAVERELVNVEGIRQAYLQVTGGGQKADVRAQLWAEPWWDPQEVAARARGRIQQRLEQLQLRSGRIELSILAAPYRRPGQQPEREPVGAETGAARG